jgi:hypothetical protein
MTLGSTQPLTETGASNLPGCKGLPAHKANNLTAICEPIVYKIWEPRCLTTLWASTTSYLDSSNFKQKKRLEESVAKTQTSRDIL